MTEFKFAVAILRGDEETIMGLFDTKAEADAYSKCHPVNHNVGLQYCYASNFLKGKPCGNERNIYNFYNAPSYA